MSIVTPELTAALRARLAGLADVLVPAGDGMPSASEAAIVDTEIDRALAARPDLLEPLLRALEEQGAPQEAIARMAKMAPADLQALRVVVLAAYYMSPRVRELLRYPGQQARPIVDDESDEILVLLQPVIQRGPTYRAAS